MKKFVIALAAAAALAAGTLSVSAENYWKYSDTMSIDMDEVKLKTNNRGHEVLNFVAVEAIEGGTCTYTIAYDRTGGTIQVVELQKETKKLSYKENFPPAAVNTSNAVVRERAQMAEAVYQKKFGNKRK